MGRRKLLSKKQLAVIDDLFSGQFDEQSVLKKHKVSRNVYNKWLADADFIDEFSRRIAWLNLQRQAIIARYASLAAAKLVQLTESEKEETARKACLDIIAETTLSAKKTEPPKNLPKTKPTAAGQSPQLPPEIAGRLLAALAEQPVNND